MEIPAARSLNGRGSASSVVVGRSITGDGEPAHERDIARGVENAARGGLGEGLTDFHTAEEIVGGGAFDTGVGQFAASIQSGGCEAGVTDCKVGISSADD